MSTVIVTNSATSGYFLSSLNSTDPFNNTNWAVQHDKEIEIGLFDNGVENNMFIYCGLSS